MTTEDKQKLEENYNTIYSSLQKLGQGLEDYKKNAKGTQKDLLFLKDLIVEFQDIIKTIVSEYAYKYPECECLDSNGEILISDTIVYLNKRGYLNDNTAEMFQQANYYGNLGGKRGKLSTSEYLDIKDVYDDIVNYLPEFVRLFPHPNLKAAQIKQEQREGQDQSSKATTQTTNNTVTTQKDADIKQKPFKKSSKNRFWLIIIAFLIIFIILAVANRHESDETENTNDQSEYEGGTDEVDNQDDIESEQDEDDDEQIEEIDEIEDTDEDADQADNEEKRYTIGETWTVKGQWEFTVDEVTSVPNPYDEEARVIAIDYHYTNIGYESGDGLYMSIARVFGFTDTTQLIDSNGIVCSDIDYPEVDDNINPEYATVGATLAARQSFKVYSEGYSATLNCKFTDDTGTEQEASFDLNW